MVCQLQTQIDGGGKPNVGWQLLAYIAPDRDEVMVSITGLEFSYTQAPQKMKSLVMAAWLFTVSLGNQFTAILNFLIPALRKSGINLDGAAYRGVFSILHTADVVTAGAFVFVARFYRGKTYAKTYVQGELPCDEVSPAH